MCHNLSHKSAYFSHRKATQFFRHSKTIILFMLPKSPSNLSVAAVVGLEVQASYEVPVLVQQRTTTTDLEGEAHIGH